MKLIILIAAALTLPAFAERSQTVRLSKACETELKNRYLTAEARFLARAGETLAGTLEARVTSSYWPDRPDMNLGVALEDKADGRYVRYGAKVSKEDAKACGNLELVRATQSACRYSRGEGPESLTEIQGLRFTEGPAIRPSDRLSKIQEEQIRALLDTDKSGAPLAELIKNTDDGELSSATVILPDGKALDYFGAYGGDNPYGAFFVSRTDTVAGTNSDGSVCIKYLK